MRSESHPFARRRGVALHRDLVAAGYSHDEIVRNVRSGQWVRLRRGAYAEAEVWLALDEEGRHLLRARAVMAALEPPATLSHVSAAIALGLPVWGVDLEAVHVTRPGRSQSRREAGVVHHNGHLPEAQIVTVDGLRVTRADRTVIDLVRETGFESGVVTADAALHRGLTTTDELLELAHAFADWPGSRRVGRVVAFADGRSESVGESRTRVLFHVHNLPKPKLQVEIWANGRLLGRVDFLVEEAMAVTEFDGRIKYRLGDGVGDGDGARELERRAWAEKRREDDIRAEGYLFSRVVWTDLDRPQVTAARIWRVINQGMRRGRQRPA